jgi:hypothetical protein
MDGLYVATPSALIAVDFCPIVRLSLSCEFHPSHYRDGGSVTIHLTKSTCASQNSLLTTVEERTDVDRSHHGPLLAFRFFDVETFE